MARRSPSPRYATSRLASASNVPRRPTPLDRKTTELPKEFLAKHPKGAGVDLVQTGNAHGQISEVLMLPIQHLGQFYESQDASNTCMAGRGGTCTSEYTQYTGTEDLILGDIVRKPGMQPVSRGYLRAGPRKTLYFNPKEVRAAIVTCGGLCPGLNNIVREVTKALHNLYGAAAVYGVRGGYWGFHGEGVGEPPMLLTHEAVSGIQHLGGTILGSARGGFDQEQIFAFCEKYKVNQLYVVGGDGTHRAANKVGARRRRCSLLPAAPPLLSSRFFSSRSA